ncbi:MAG TPA: MDR family MFS transporter [Segeticoccus sp.]|uniref:MDR family MFS transporter n=1 Tax=Segeticoccus sp. TaxID=2706531 RepID=UPI002D80C1F2|nr:MDR family MFS transporter [Segeticoccus sp.]HET8599338.1 MDR family MFS transporter [Segeticoccus sp.]
MARKTAHDERRPVLAALILAMALVAMDTTIVATAIPQVVGDLGGFSLVGWVFSIYLLAQTVTIPVYGKLADIYGRKPVLVIGVVVFLIGSVLSAAAWNMPTLIAFRALQGLGAGSIGATVNTVAGDLYEVEERGRVQGWLSSVWGISAVVAPAIGGLFAQYASWRWIFLVNLPIGAVALTLILRGLHEQVQRRSHRIDYAGAALLLTSAALLILGLLQGGTAWAWSSAQSILVFVGALLAGVAAVLVERRAAEPVVPLWLWTRRLTGGSYAATFTAGLMVIGLSTFLPTWGQAVLGLSPVAAGFVLAVMSMTWPVASGLSARLYLRVGFRDTALLGSGFAVASGVVFALMSAHAGVWQPVLGSALMGAGMGLITSPLIVGLQSTVGWSSRGVVTGGAMFARFLGQSLGAAVFGAVTNAVLLHQLADAPVGVRARVPHRVDGVSRALEGGHAQPAVAEFLRGALHDSTHAVFLGLLAGAVVTAVILVTVVPRVFSVAEDRPPVRLQ